MRYPRTHTHTHTLVCYQLHSKSTFVRVNFCALLLAAFIARFLSVPLSLPLPLFIIITYSGNHSEKRRIKCKEIYTIPRQSVRLKSTCTTELVNEPRWNWIRLRIRCQPAYSLCFSQIEREREDERESNRDTDISAISSFLAGISFADRTWLYRRTACAPRKVLPGRAL